MRNASFRYSRRRGEAMVRVAKVIVKVVTMATCSLRRRVITY